MKKDILIIMADQLRYDIRSAKGFALDTMPTLDSLEKIGLEFDIAYTPNPTCMPARVSMFTGRVPSCHNVRTNHNAMDATYTEDLLDILKREGYRTALCGKNHSHRSPSDFDFARVNGHLGVEDGHELSKEASEFDAFLKTLSFCDSMEPSPFTAAEQLPHRNVDDFLTFFDSCRSDGVPSFTWLSFAEPHNPYQVPYPYYDMFPPESLPEIETGWEDVDDRGPGFAFMDWAWDKVYKENRQKRILRDRSNYYGMLRLIDDEIKRVFEELAKRDALDNMLIFILADHGEFVGEYGLIRKGCSLAEVLVHIPFIVITPGGRRGHETKACANIIDILPTICDELGCKVPFGVQGKSLMPIIKGEDYPEEDYSTAYSESGFGGLYWDREKDALDPVLEGATEDYTAFDCLNSWTQCGQCRTVRKGKWKLISDMMGYNWLYDLESDPLERINLTGKPEMRDVELELAHALAAEMMRKADLLPSPAHRYRTKIHPKGWFFDTFFHTKEDEGVVHYPIQRRMK